MSFGPCAELTIDQLDSLLLEKREELDNQEFPLLSESALHIFGRRQGKEDTRIIVLSIADT
ncbi:hypothetical protein BJ968_004556 [Kineococcus aurantiacus]|uniref:Uncharacterized protein n=1 Tax=Kineococcus aurantiacus TaxID=37633 RepID=A0A7Y9DQL5_9ACTN|nr:hypothetical protein [Kineococcus aurantiacus]